jgi:hypothetical protein
MKRMSIRQVANATPRAREADVRNALAASARKPNQKKEAGKGRSAPLGIFEDAQCVRFRV